MADSFNKITCMACTHKTTRDVNGQWDGVPYVRKEPYCILDARGFPCIGTQCTLFLASDQYLEATGDEPRPTQ